MSNNSVFVILTVTLFNIILVFVSSIKTVNLLEPLKLRTGGPKKQRKQGGNVGDSLRRNLTPKKMNIERGSDLTLRDLRLFYKINKGPVSRHVYYPRSIRTQLNVS